MQQTFRQMKQIHNDMSFDVYNCHHFISLLFRNDTKITIFPISKLKMKDVLSNFFMFNFRNDFWLKQNSYSCKWFQNRVMPTHNAPNAKNSKNPLRILGGT